LLFRLLRHRRVEEAVILEKEDEDEEDEIVLPLAPSDSFHCLL
jgi:hypothetical protein